MLSLRTYMCVHAIPTRTLSCYLYRSVRWQSTVHLIQNETKEEYIISYFLLTHVNLLTRTVGPLSCLSKRTRQRPSEHRYRHGAVEWIPAPTCTPSTRQVTENRSSTGCTHTNEAAFQPASISAARTSPTAWSVQLQFASITHLQSPPLW